jgi:hypothetical protein
VFEDRPTLGGSRDATITFGFDRDDNPYNGVYGSRVSFATSSLASDTLNTSIPTSNVAGGFRVYAKISNGTTTRYDYAPGRAVVTVPTYSETWIGPASGSWTAASNWSGGTVPAAGDRVAIYDSAVTLPATTTVAGLLIGGSGSLDLGANDLVVNYGNEPSPLATWNGSAYTGITGLIARGSIRSSAATPNLTTLGAADASDVLDLTAPATATWNGQDVDSTSVLVKFTYAGDANLDGHVDIADYGRIDSAVRVAFTGWSNGDFNLDGKIDIADYGIIDSNIRVQGSPL